MSRTFAFIPARSGSQRIVNKNLTLVNGHPLIAYTIDCAKRAGIFDAVIVSTDSQEIAEVAFEYGAKVHQLRPVEFSSGSSPDIEWIKFELSIQNYNDDDVIFIMRPTNPLRKPKTIIDALQLFKSKTSIDSLRAMRPVKEHPSKMWRLSNNMEKVEPFDSRMNLTTGTYNHSSPMQTLEPLLIQDASLEITTVRSIKSNSSISGNQVIGFQMPGYEGFDINYPDDLEYLEFLNTKKKIEYPAIVKEILK